MLRPKLESIGRKLYYLQCEILELSKLPYEPCKKLSPVWDKVSDANAEIQEIIKGV